MSERNERVALDLVLADGPHPLFTDASHHLAVHDPKTCPKCLRCRSWLLLAGKRDRCRRPRDHTGVHRWWSQDRRVTVGWARNAGGSRWRWPVKR